MLESLMGRLFLVNCAIWVWAAARAVGLGRTTFSRTRPLSDGPPGVPTCVMKWAVDGPVGWKAQRSACSAVRPHKERPQSIFPPFVDS